MVEGGGGPNILSSHMSNTSAHIIFPGWLGWLSRQRLDDDMSFISTDELNDYYHKLRDM